jgi:hypothetical protein
LTHGEGCRTDQLEITPGGRRGPGGSGAVVPDQVEDPGPVRPASGSQVARPVIPELERERLTF